MHHLLRLFGLALSVVFIALARPTLPEAAVAPPGPVGVPPQQPVPDTPSPHARA